MKHPFLACLLIYCAGWAAGPAARGQEGPRPSVYGVPDAVGPTPTAAGLGRYGEIPVSYYTGLPQIVLPLHQLGTGGAPLPIALSYHAGGIRVEEEAGPVGLGWSLQAGGVITRTVNGLPDETYHGGYGGGPVTNPDHPAYNAGQSVESNTSVQSGKFYTVQQHDFVKNFADGLYDAEPDDYYVNFAGHAGRLFFDPLRHAFLSPVNFWRIEGYPGRAVPGTTANFIITDEHGVRYVFGDRETTQTATYSYTSSWYLTRIEYPNGEQVRFTYAPEPSKSAAAVPETRAELVGGQGTVEAPPAAAEGPPDVETFPLRLVAVASRTDSVALAYSGRLDSELSKLDSVGVWTAGGQHRQTWRLAYAYAGGGTGDTGRLLLQTLQRVGEPAHAFGYYADPGPNFPAPRYRQDHWGYLNNNTQGQSHGPTALPAAQVQYGGHLFFFEGADKTPDATAAAAYTLRQVQYPTGGRTVYTYEANDYGYDVAHQPVLDTAFTARRANAFVNGNVTRANWRPRTAFIVDHKQVVPFSWAASYSGTDPVFPTMSLVYPDGSQYDFPDQSPATAPSGGGGSTGNAPPPTRLLGTTNLVLLPGRYVLVYADSAAGPLAPNNANSVTAAYSSCLDANGGVNAVKFKKTGGLRIAALAHYDGLRPQPVRTQHFSYRLPGDPDRSSGMETSPAPVYGHLLTITTYNTNSTTVYYAYSSRPGSSLGTTQGGVVGYRAVAVQTDSTGGQGREEFTYSSLFDHPNRAYELAAKRFPFAPANGHEEQLGLLLRHRVYRAAPSGAQLVAEERHSYRFDGALARTVYGTKLAYTTIARFGVVGGPGSTDVSMQERFTGNPYSYSTAWVRPADETRVQYDPRTGDSLVARTAYTYDARDGQLVRTVRPLADRTLVTRTRFAAEYDTMAAADPAAQAVRNLVRYHQLTGVVEQQQWVVRGADSVLVGAQATRYRAAAAAPRLVLPEQRLQLRPAAPLTAGQYAPTAVTAAGAFAADAQLQPALVFDRYDAWGHLLQGHVPGGPFVSYAWGYRSTLPIAEVSNASADQVRAALGVDPDRLATDAQLRAAFARLRAQLPAARVTGYTHAPLLGLNSQTGPDGRVTTYEYDALGRLLRTRDEQGHILSQQQYHYAGQ